MGSRKTKAELTAEVEGLRSRVAELEQKPKTHKRSNHLLRAFIDVLPYCGCSLDAGGIAFIGTKYQASGNRLDDTHK